MAVHLTAMVICICGVELLSRAPLYETIVALLQYAKKSSHVIASRKISDHWKEKVLPTYSLRVAQNSLKLLFIFLVIFSALLLLSKALDFLFLAETTTVGYLSTWRGILFATLASTIYYYVRSSLLKK